MAYQSSYTGYEIDRAIGEVRKRAKAWDGKQQKLTGSPGQLVGFDERGNAVPVDGGSGSANAPAAQRWRVKLLAAGWEDLTQTVYIEGISADEGEQLIQPVPTSASFGAYAQAEIHVSQSLNQLAFTCKQPPLSDLDLYVVIQNLGGEAHGV